MDVKKALSPSAEHQTFFRHGKDASPQKVRKNVLHKSEKEPPKHNPSCCWNEAPSKVPPYLPVLAVMQTPSKTQISKKSGSFVVFGWQECLPSCIFSIRLVPLIPARSILFCYLSKTPIFICKKFPIQITPLATN